MQPRAFLRPGIFRRAIALPAFALAASLPSLAAAATLLTWNITGTTGSTSGGVAAAPALGVSGSVITAGGTAGNSTSPSGTWNRTFPLNADANAAQTAGNFFSWTTTAEAGYVVTINGFTGLNLSRTTTGPANAELWYSSDNITYAKTGSTFTVTGTLASAAGAFDDTIATTPIILDASAGIPVVGYWRLVVYGGTAASRLGIGNADAANDFSIHGTMAGGSARDLVWNGGSGSWDTSASNTAWLFSGAPSAFSANDNVTINSDGTLSVDAAGVSVGSTVVNVSSGTVTLSGGSLTGTTLAKSGAGSLALQAANTFSGGVSVTGGTLQIGAPGALGSQSVTLDGATLRIADAAIATLSNSVAVGNADATITVDAGVITTVSGVISASGTTAGVGVSKGDPQTFNTLVKNGPGKLALAGNLGAQMTFNTGAGTSGVTTSGGVALHILGGSMEIANGRAWNLASGIDLDAVDPVTGQTTGTYNGMVWNGDVLMRGGRIQINGGNVRGAGVITVGVVGETAATNTLGQRLNFNSPDILNAVVVSAGHTLTLDSQSGGSIALLGPVAGAGTITNTGNGTARVQPSAPSAFAGIFVNTQRMELSAQALAAASQVTTAGALTLSNRLANTGAVVAAPIAGVGSVTKTGDGDVVLAGNNTFVGGLFLASAGGVLIESPAALGAGTLAAAHEAARVGLAPAAPASVTIANTLSSGVADPLTSYAPVLAFAPGAGRAVVLTGSISGSGQLKISGGGDLDLTPQTSVTNTNTGGVEIGTGRVLASGDENLGQGAINFGTISGSTLFVAGTSSTASFSRNITIGSTSTTGYTAIIHTNGKTVTWSGSVSDRAGNAAGGAVSKTGAGELILAGALSYGGDTAVEQGVLTLNSANQANAGASVRIATGAVLDLAFSGSMTVNALYLNGVQQSAGTYSATHASGALSGSGSLVVTSGPAPTDAFAAWAASYQLAGAQTAATADPDGDGQVNLLEYALGTNPIVAGPSPVGVSRSGANLSLTYVRVADPAVTYTVEGANELAGPWSAVLIGGNPSTGAANVAGNVTVTDTANLSGQPRRFLRLTVAR